MNEQSPPYLLSDLPMSGRNEIDPQALAILAKFNQPSLKLVLSAIAEWTQGVHVISVNAIAAREPEDTWEEAVLEIRIDAKTSEALSLWNKLSQSIDKAKANIAVHDRKMLDSKLGIQVIW